MRKEILVDWPQIRGSQSISLTSKEPYIDKPIIEDAIKATKKNRKNTFTRKRPIRISVIDLRWLFDDKKNIIAFI